VAEAVTAVLAQARDARAICIDEFPAGDLNDVDLVVMGSPTHYQSLPKNVRAVLDALPKQTLSGRSVAAFDTSLKMWGPIMLLTAGHRLLAKLRKLGGKRIVPAETFLVKSVERPPEGEFDMLCEGEIERAGEWAATILGRL
jgi:flavodoxin